MKKLWLCLAALCAMNAFAHSKPADNAAAIDDFRRNFHEACVKSALAQLPEAEAEKAVVKEQAEQMCVCGYQKGVAQQGSEQQLFDGYAELEQQLFQGKALTDAQRVLLSKGAENAVACVLEIKQASTK